MTEQTIRQTQVEGIPTLIAPTEGRLHAGIAFRVGMADEELPRRGITHLIEHLALQSAGVADYHYNGATTPRYTYFHMQGSQQEVVSFLNGVCSSLRALPAGRLETEKEILRTEAAGRSRSSYDSLAVYRYGARGFGASSYPEWGLGALTMADLEGWVEHFFTADNAVLWIGGDDVPPGLELGLPRGQRRPLPPVSSALPQRPAFFTGDGSVLAWDAIVAETGADLVYAAMLKRALFRSLRQEGGLSYQADADSDWLADGTARISAYADAAPEKHGAVVGAFVDVLASFRVGRIDEAELASVVGRMTDEMSQTTDPSVRLPGQAVRLLTGSPVRQLDETIEMVRAVTREQVAATALEAWNDGLLMTPGGTAARWAAMFQAPVYSTTSVQGTTYTYANDPRAHLDVGPDGVSLVDVDGERLTVRYAECVAALAWPDGARRLIGSDAIGLTVEPTVWTPTAGLTELIDASIPPAVRIPQPPRDPSDIPAPRPPEPPANPPRVTTAGTILGIVLLVPLGLIGLALAIFAIAGTATDPNVDTVEVVVAIFFAVFGLFLAFGSVWLIRRILRGRRGV